MVNPDVWPSMVAEAKTLIRQRLTGYESLVEVTQILTLMLNERGYEHFLYDQREAERRYDANYWVQAGEVIWAVGEALRELKVDGEIRFVSGGISPSAVRFMWQQAGLDAASVNDYPLPQVIAATPRRVRRADFAATTNIRWDAVTRLLNETRRAHLEGLEVLSSVGARIAVEEAVRAALIDLGIPEEDQRTWASQREDDLFERLAASAFSPMDKSSTRAALSGVRDHGNTVAHTGKANNALLNELLVSILPRALQSLSAAVEAKM